MGEKKCDVLNVGCWIHKSRLWNVKEVKRVTFEKTRVKNTRIDFWALLALKSSF